MEGFAHLIVCELLWNNVRERLADGSSSNVAISTRHAILRAATERKRTLGGSGSDPLDVKPFSTLTLSRGIERFDVDEEKLRVALLLNPESLTNESSAVFTCGLLVSARQISPRSADSNALDHKYEYIRHKMEVLIFNDSPTLPSASCRIELHVSRGAQLRCALNAESLLLQGQWFLEWCRERCSLECQRCRFSSSNSAHTNADMSPKLPECVVSGAEDISLGIAPRLLRLVGPTDNGSRVLDAYSPAHHISILHLPSVWKFHIVFIYIFNRTYVYVQALYNFGFPLKYVLVCMYCTVYSIFRTVDIIVYKE